MGDGSSRGDVGEVDSGLLDRVASAAGAALRRQMPRVDVADRDPDLIERLLPWLTAVSAGYFRSVVRGLRHIPKRGPVLLVGNHSGGSLIPDTLVFYEAFVSRFGARRQFHVLAHDAVLMTPLGRLLIGAGALPASNQNARRALEAGSAVLVYPGGDWETHRPTWQSDRIDFAGRTGFVKLALATNVPIVPVVAIGGQETALFLSRGESLARLLRLDRLIRTRVLPINIGPPWGLNIGDISGRLPLPAQITVQVLPPIRLRDRFGPRPRVQKIYDHVTQTMQERLRELADERQRLRP